MSAFAIALFGGAAMLSPTVAAAQDTQTTTVEEVIVTSQRRAENVQDVPISVVAISADQIADSGITDFATLTQYTSGLTTDLNGDARASRIGLRGVTTAQENGKQSSVGVFIDGVYLSRVGMAFADLVDIERIEVLRGPQGTLFGMNTSAGLIHIITAKPDVDAFGGFVEAVAGNYNRTEVRANITGPIVPGQLGFSLGGYSVSRRGIIYNETLARDVDDQKRWGVRGKLGYEAPNLDVQLIADYQEEASECCVNVLVHLKPGATIAGTSAALLAPADYPFSRTAATSAPNFNEPKGGGVSGEINWQLGGHTLTSVTAWRFWDIHSLNDPDSVALKLLDNYLINQEHTQFSQEFRIASPAEQRLEYLFGLFYFNRTSEEHSEITFNIPAFHAPADDGATIADFHIEDISYAAFGRVAFHVTDQLTASVGARYTTEQQDVRAKQVARNFISPNYVRTDSRDEGQLTYNFTVDYDVTEDIMVYASVARGFKPGGFDMGRPASFTEFQFEEETNINTEAGVRSVILDRRLLLNATVFNTVYTNFQTLQFDGIRFLSGNAPEFVSRGLELEATANFIEGLTLRGSASFIEAKYTDFPLGACPQGVTGSCDLTDRTLPQAPKTTISGSALYTWPLGIGDWDAYVLGEYAYRSGAYFNQALDPNLHQDAYSLVHLRVGVESANGLKIEAWSRNLLDEDYISFAFNSPLMSGGYAGFLGEPRMYGVRIRKEF